LDPGDGFIPGNSADESSGEFMGVNKFPDDVFSDNLAGNPEQYAGNPEQYLGNPEQYEGNPEQYAGNPEQYAGNPEQYAESPGEEGGYFSDPNGRPWFSGTIPNELEGGASNVSDGGDGAPGENAIPGTTWAEKEGDGAFVSGKSADKGGDDFVSGTNLSEFEEYASSLGDGDVGFSSGKSADEGGGLEGESGADAVASWHPSSDEMRSGADSGSKIQSEEAHHGIADGDGPDGAAAEPGPDDVG
jgi:hypothetical protein